MSNSDPILERLGRAAEAAAGDDQRAATFVRGLALGALVGAAIAGSTIWQRRHGRPTKPPVGAGPVSPGSPVSTTGEDRPNQAETRLTD